MPLIRRQRSLDLRFGILPGSDGKEQSAGSFRMKLVPNPENEGVLRILREFVKNPSDEIPKNGALFPSTSKIENI